jgi:hypothetical protein
MAYVLCGSTAAVFALYYQWHDCGVAYARPTAESGRAEMVAGFANRPLTH